MPRIVILLATVLLALSGCTKSATKPNTLTEDSTAVALVTVEAAPSEAALDAAGTVRFKRETPLSFSTNGRIAQILVTEGQIVSAGQLLARLDPTVVDAVSAAARAENNRAMSDYNRLDQLFQKGWITKPRLESAAATLAAARARVEQTGYDVRLARIIAPTAGTVLQRHAEPGQVTGVGQPVLTLGESASGYVLRVPMTDSQTSRLQLGQSAAVQLPGLSLTPLRAIISEIGARSDDRTGTFEVELRLPLVAGLRSGLIGQARIAVSGGATPAPDNVQFSVPATSIFAARADEAFVYVYNPSSGRVQARLVGLGTVDDKRVVITHGLTAGERVARSGVDRLRSGMKVRIAA